MKPYYVNLINALVLIGLSFLGYLSSETPSITALIPAFVGILLLLCDSGLRKENKIVSHVAVFLTFIIVIGLIKPLLGALDRKDNLAIIRVCIMIFTATIALISFIKSFIEVRTKRLSNNNRKL